MAGFLPNDLDLITNELQTTDIFIAQVTGENSVRKVLYSDILSGALTPSDIGVANGVCPLDSNSLIPTSHLPSLAITDVYVVSDISSRDSLTVQKGDVVKVTDKGDGTPQTYIYDGTNWIDIQESSDVISVNGKTGVVVLSTSDISDTTDKRYVTDSEKTKLGYISVTQDIYLDEALTDSDIGVTVQGYDSGTVIDPDYSSVKGTINAGGDSASRPASPVLYQNYFDTDLNKPIWYNGTDWVDATGTVV